MNRYPLWRYLLILAVLAFGIIYSLPNLYTPDPALQVTGQSTTQAVDEGVIDDIKSTLEAAGIGFFGGQLHNADALIRFHSTADQLKAKDILQAALGSDFVVALNLAPTTPEWLGALGASPMKLGLDLRGGVHFLLQVDTGKVVDKYLETQLEELKRAFREGDARFRSLRQDGRSLVVIFADSKSRDSGEAIVRSDFRDFIQQPRAADDPLTLRLEVLETVIRERENYAVGQNLTTLRNRVNEIGVSEPVVQRQGRDRIVVELPGVQDTAAAKRIIVGVILYVIGSGPVQGFAVVLTLGILTSMFTALTGTRALVNLCFGNRHNLQKLWI